MQNTFSTLTHLAGALLNRSPLVQAVKQRSFAPYKQAMNNFAPQNIVPMGRAQKISRAAYAKALSPESIAAGARAFEADARQYRIEQRALAQAHRARQAFEKVWQPGRSQELISNYINKKR